MYDDGLMFLVGVAIGGSTTLVVYLIQRLLGRSINWFSIIGLAVCLGFASITYQQMNKKRAILGYGGERFVAQKKITRKKEELYRGKGKTETRYYLCYKDGKEVCANVDEWVWITERVGNNMPIVRVAGDDESYHRSGLYTTNGNLGIDRFLLYLKLFGALIFILKIIFPKFLSFERFNKPENIKLFD
jgi:hypothetical protein